jgi:hypothetical protein
LGQCKRRAIDQDRFRTVKCFGAVFLLIATLPLAIADDDAYEADRIEFVVGNVVFVMLHEFSHLIIQDFDVPVLGNSEDAADTLAAVTLIRADRARPESDFRLIRMLLTAADANRILWQRSLEQDNSAVYLARHPLSVQRAARINCLAYGSDMELLEPLPEIVGLPEFRAFWCDEEYNDAEMAWLWVRDSFVRESTGTATEHQFTYGSTRDPGRQAIRDRLMQNEVLERTLAYVGRTMLLPDAITLRTSSCGSPDAYWDEDTREIVICYQLIEAFYQLSEEQGIKDLVEKIRAFHRDHRAGSEDEP